MKQVSFQAAAASLLLLSDAGCAQSSEPASADAGHRAGDEVASAASADDVPDPPGTGSYPAIKEVIGTLPDHVVYRPADLGGLGERKLGVLLWGNGGCRADGASARLHLLEIASHGYVAIAPGQVHSGPGAMESQAEPSRSANSDEFPPVETTPEDMLEALDWVLAENERPHGPLYDRIDPQAVAVAGHSCGGLQAIKISADPRIATTLIHNSGVLNPGTPNPITGLSVDKSELARLHAPVLYVLGGESDVAYPNGMDDVSRIAHVPVAVASLDVGHGGTFDEPNGGRAASVAVRWLEWQLRGDTEAAQWFAGADCILCESDEWRYQAKGF